MNKDDPREAQIIDKGCYWLICIPVEPDDAGWNWRGVIWCKGDNGEYTKAFKKNIAAIEEWAEQFMKCN